jgi:hypothetical protein
MKPTQLGCKKCGAVLTIEPKVGSDRIDVRTKEARVQDRSGTIEIECKKCLKPVATVKIVPA